MYISQHLLKIALTKNEYHWHQTSSTEPVRELRPRHTLFEHFALRMRISNTPYIPEGLRPCLITTQIEPGYHSCATAYAYAPPVESSWTSYFACQTTTPVGIQCNWLPRCLSRPDSATKMSDAARPGSESRVVEATIEKLRHSAKFRAEYPGRNSDRPPRIDLPNNGKLSQTNARRSWLGTNPRSFRRTVCRTEIDTLASTRSK